MARQTFVAEFLAARVELAERRCATSGGRRLLPQVPEGTRTRSRRCRAVSKNCCPVTATRLDTRQLTTGRSSSSVASAEGSRVPRRRRHDHVDARELPLVSTICYAAAASLPAGRQIVVATGSRIWCRSRSRCSCISRTRPRTAIASASARITADRTRASRLQDRCNESLHRQRHPLRPGREGAGRAEQSRSKKDHPLEVLSFFERWHQRLGPLPPRLGGQ